MENLPLSFAIVFFVTIAAGLLQSTASFGGAILMTLIFPLAPLCIPLLQASGLSTLFSITATSAMAWRYRKHIKPKIAIPPAIFYFIASTIALRIAAKADTSGLKVFFGALLMVLAVYFIFFAGKFQVKPTLLTAAVCGSLAGVCGGLFGIGGPPVIIYVLAITGEDKDSYIGNIQFFFTIASIYSTLMRVVNGIFTVDILPFVIPGMVGIFLGKTIGARIVSRINLDVMKKIIYIFMGLSGLVTFVTNL